MAARRFARPAQEGRNTDLVERAVARATQGHSDAFHLLYVRFADEVGAFVRVRVSDAEAETVTRTVFAELLSDIQHYDPGETPFATWILRLAEKVVSSKGFAGRQSVADRHALAGAGDDREHGRSPPLHEALSRLPDDQRRVLVLRHIAGLSTREIAERLGNSEASVHELHENGRRALQAAAAVSLE
jgi:DNA-directed RNA polymerase specialized sigma24 family protein